MKYESELVKRNIAELLINNGYHGYGSDKNFLHIRIDYALQWLRLEHNIDVCYFIETSMPYKDYCCRIYKDGEFIRDKVAYGDDYYECINDGIRIALEYL